MESAYTLEILHIADQEASTGAIVDAPNLSAVLNALRDEDLGGDGLPDNTLTLSSGDAFIPGVFFDASEEAFGFGGIADIQIQNELGIEAIALGNHEFDFGTRTLSELITGQDVTDDSDPDDGFVDTVPQSIGQILGEDFGGADFPYLSTNLDFSTDGFMAPLEVDGGQAPQGNVVTSSTVIAIPTNNPSMVDGEAGFTSTPIHTVGQSVESTGALNDLNVESGGQYTPVGIIDGIGAYALDDSTVRIFTNHELLHFRGNEYEVSDGQGGSFSMTGARISYFDIDKETKQITDGGIAYNTIIDANGDVASDLSFLGSPFAPGFGAGPGDGAPLAGFSRFCSSQFVDGNQFGEGRGVTENIYFAGEEDGGGFNSIGGGMWALDVDTGVLYDVPGMGNGAWENITQLDTGNDTNVAFILSDDSSPFNSDDFGADANGDDDDEAAPLFMYVGEKDAASDDFLERNGLDGGKLYVWVADTADTDSPAEFNGTGSTEGGIWVEVDNSPTGTPSEDGSSGFDEFGYPTQRTLWERAEAVGAFGFSRPEDVSTNPEDGSEFVMASTGVDTFDVDPNTGNGADSFGTIYTMSVDFSDIDAPTGTLNILYDGDDDPSRALRSPDNLDWADDGKIYIQEDEAEESTASGDEVLFGEGAANPNEAGIVRIDPTDGSVERIANINRDVILDPTTDGEPVDQDAGNAGEWETSGILDVSTLFDEEPGTLFLYDVQAHGIEDQDDINADSRLNDDDLVEGGQLAFLSAPGVNLGEAAEKIGVVGATTPTLATISSSDDVGVSPDPFDGSPTPDQLDALAAEIQAEVDALLAANPDMNKVVLLAHMQQIDIELALAERLTDVDVIVAGGSNTRLFDDNDRIRDGDTDQGEYPQFVENAGGTTTAVVNTDGSYKYVGRLVLDFDEDGNVIAESYDEDVSGAYATDEEGVAALGAEGLVDPEIQEIVDAIETEIIEAESNVFGISDVFLNGNRSGGDTDGVRIQETNLGNLTADANLAAAKEFDDSVVVSIKNGGGIRASIGESVVLPGTTEAARLPNSALFDGDGNLIKPEGGISQNDIATTLAFNNALTLLTLTKAELVEVLEHGVAATTDDPNNAQGRFPQVSGVKFSFDVDLPEGDRIVSAGIFDENDTLIAELVRDGEIVGDASETFRIVTLNFLAGGGDGYPFPDGPDANRIDLNDIDGDGIDDDVFSGDATFEADGTEQDALAEFLNDNFPDENSAFAAADTPRELDERIQNLDLREDTVLPDSGSSSSDAPEPANVLETQIVGEIELDGAEIITFDADTQRAFVTSGDGLQVIDASDLSALSVIDTLDPAALGFNESEFTSVDVANGIIAASRPDSTATENGQVLFFSASTLDFLGFVTVGALPDSVAFNEAGTHLVVANEGESAGDENEPDADPNPEGSISIIELNTANLTLSTVTTLDFSDPSISFASLEQKGVRTNRDAPSAAADIEPEFVTVEGNKAFITLQENNAVAVIEDVTAPSPLTIDSIQSLGLQDHRGGPSLETFDFGDLPLLGVDANGLEIDLGGFSGLYFTEETSEAITFLAVPDRGPNGSEVVQGARTFNLPDYQAQIVELTLDKSTGVVEIGEQLLLTREDGTTPITGLPNIEGFDEIPVDAAGNPLPFDEFGADMEGIVRDTDGTFWTVDEYRPAIYHFDTDGSLIDRFVAEGTSLLGDVPQPEGTFGSETLPEDYADRRPNRGFEAVAADLEARKLYAFIQTPLANPDRDASDNSDVIRILELDMDTGLPSAEYVYLLEDPGIRPGGRVDKIGDAVFNPETGTIYAIERDANFDAEATKNIFEIDLSGATNVLGTDFGGETLEQQSADDLEDAGIVPVFKVKTANLPQLGYTPSDKPEGLALLPDGSLAVLNDNDFGIEDSTGLLPQLGIISFEGNSLDPSNEDGGINIGNFDVRGLRQGDAIASYTVAGVTYYLTANEGDGRDVDESRGADLVDGDPDNGEVDAGLDPELLAQLADEAVLGRLKFSNVDGDTDGDGDIDVLHSFGGRSFSIFDEFGNLVYDSGDDFELITAAVVPDIFNSNGEVDSFDSRSDDKGPEPEAVTLGDIGDQTYAFIGLERVGGIMVYDVTDPTAPVFDQYIPGGDDLGPEGLKFIAPEDSPTGTALLAVASEESETLTFHEFVSTLEPSLVEVIGVKGSEKLVGTDEAELFNGLEGNDRYFGLGGGDRFVMNPQDRDWVRDYNQEEGDIVDLSEWGVTSLDDIILENLGNSMTITDVNDVKNFARLFPHDKQRLDVSEFTEDSFIFAETLV